MCSKLLLHTSLAFALVASACKSDPAERLSTAISRCDSSNLRTILETLPADSINARDPLTGSSALHLAITKCPALVPTLLARGADYYLRDALGQDAMVAAVFSEDTARVAMLLRYGYELAGARATEALAEAVRFGIEPMYNYLLQQGVSVAGRSYSGGNVLHLIVNYPMLDTAWLLRLVFDGVAISGIDTAGNTPLNLAAGGADLSVVNFLASRDADVNAPNNRGTTPVHSAAWHRSNPAGAMKILLSKGGDPNRLDNELGSPMMVAAWRADTATLQALYDAGAKLDLQDNRGWTALLYALWQQKDRNAKWLVSHGADPTLKPYDKATPGPLDYKREFIPRH